MCIKYKLITHFITQICLLNFQSASIERVGNANIKPVAFYDQCIEHILFPFFSVKHPIKDKMNRYIPYSAGNWNVDYGYSKYAGIETYPRRALLSGSANALKVNMNVDMDDLDYACTSFQGFQVVLHQAIRYPTVQQHYFRVPLGKSVIVAVSPSQIVTSVKVKQYSTSKRKCLFQSEVSLKYFKHYTQDNCKLECLTDYTLQKCGCVAFFMPRKYFS